MLADIIAKNDLKRSKTIAFSDKEILEKLIEINNERNISVGLFESGKSGVMVLEIEIEIQDNEENHDLYYKHLQEQF